jgi:hypothetical protein
MWMGALMLLELKTTPLPGTHQEVSSKGEII